MPPCGSGPTVQRIVRGSDSGPGLLRLGLVEDVGRVITFVSSGVTYSLGPVYGLHTWPDRYPTTPTPRTRLGLRSYTACGSCTYACHIPPRFWTCDRCGFAKRCATVMPRSGCMIPRISNSHWNRCGCTVYTCGLFFGVSTAPNHDTMTPHISTACFSRHAAT